MRVFFELLATLPVMVICYQLYTFAAHSTGVVRQRRLQKLGVAYMTMGILALVSREPVFVFSGLVLIMAGLRLMAKGLDRLDKHIFIDRYDGHNNGTAPKKKDTGD
jgi:hypothetical protein